MSSPSALSRPKGLLLWPAIAKLARWRFKQMWRFLFVTWLGMLAMVTLACAPPLFSRVAISATLRDVTAHASDGRNIIVQVVSLSPTVAQVQQISQQLDHVLKQSSVAAYLQGAPQIVVQTPPLALHSSSKPKPADRSNGLVLDGYDSAQVAQHATVVQGRLPRATSDGTIEIALPQDLVNNLGVHVDATLHGSMASVLGAQAWTLHVVGIIAPRSVHDSFWLADANPFGSLHSTANGATAHNVLAAGETIRLLFDKTASHAALQTLPGKDPAHLFWSYPFDVTRLDANNIPTLAQQMSDLAEQITTVLPQIQGVTFAFPGGALFETLSDYIQQIVILEIALTFLLLLILAIILFLVSMMSDILIERQATIIAMLRSRGATQQHIFGTFVAQGVVVGLAALLVGPLLALLLVRVIAQVLLSPTNQQALAVITAHPVQAILNVKWFAVGAVGVALFVMIVAIRQSSKLDIVTLRREAARGQRVSLWRRFNLDLLVVLLIVVGYGIYTYVWQSFTTAQAFDPLIYNTLKVGGFLAPPFLVAALLLLFLRLFPLILRLATSIAAKKRSASAILAFAQMERNPRPAARVIVLLVLAITASCFLCTLMATKQARTTGAATFAVGADFSGPLPAADSFKSFDTLKTSYSSLPGVQAATIGYSDVLDNPGGDIHISAVDADTYAHTALWSPQVTTQSLPEVTAQLVSHRSDAITRNVVYAFVDTVLWQKYGLSQGDTFVLSMNEAGTARVHFIALGLINYIPGTYNAPIDPESDIGLIVDYQSYGTVYAKLSGMSLSPNYVWLHTRDDASALASIRRVLPDLQNRRLLTTANQENSTHVDIMGVLAIGVGAALILALLGTLLSSWLHASSRLTSFALVRALGMAPRQIASVLLWEQGFVYMLALLLGCGLGSLLTIFVAPAVALLDLAGPSSRVNPYDVPPIQTVIPYPQLLLLLGGLVLICLVALLLMARIVSRPSMSQTLRLNED